MKNSMIPKRAWNTQTLLGVGVGILERRFQTQALGKAGSAGRADRDDLEMLCQPTVRNQAGSQNVSLAILKHPCPSSFCCFCCDEEYSDKSNLKRERGCSDPQFKGTVHCTHNLEAEINARCYSALLTHLDTPGSQPGYGTAHNGQRSSHLN